MDDKAQYSLSSLFYSKNFIEYNEQYRLIEESLCKEFIEKTSLPLSACQFRFFYISQNWFQYPLLSITNIVISSLKIYDDFYLNASFSINLSFFILHLLAIALLGFAIASLKIGDFKLLKISLALVIVINVDLGGSLFQGISSEFQRQQNFFNYAPKAPGGLISFLSIIFFMQKKVKLGSIFYVIAVLFSMQYLPIILIPILSYALGKIQKNSSLVKEMYKYIYIFYIVIFLVLCFFWILSGIPDLRDPTSDILFSVSFFILLNFFLLYFLYNKRLSPFLNNILNFYFVSFGAYLIILFLLYVGGYFFAYEDTGPSMDSKLMFWSTRLINGEIFTRYEVLLSYICLCSAFFLFFQIYLSNAQQSYFTSNIIPISLICASFYFTVGLLIRYEFYTYNLSNMEKDYSMTIDDAEMYTINQKKEIIFSKYWLRFAKEMTEKYGKY